MKEWFYTITQSMLELGLRGTELNLFAVIYGYSQKGDGCFYGTRGELCERCGVSSLRTIDSALNSLVEKGLIRRFDFEKEGQKYTAYGCAISARGGVQNLHGGCAKIARGGCANSAHMKNKDIENKKKYNTTTAHPSVDAVVEYVGKKGFRDPSGFASYYVEFNDNREWIAANGKPVKNWKNNILNNWMKYKDQVFDQNPTSSPVTPTHQSANLYYTIHR